MYILDQYINYVARQHGFSSKLFADKAPPTPIEIMVFLTLGWLFVLAGNYLEMRVQLRLNKSWGNRSIETLASLEKR